MMTEFVTMAVLAGAYRGRAEERGLLTHAVSVVSGKALCSVKAENLTDDGRGDTVPTCPTCRRRMEKATLDRMKADTRARLDAAIGDK
jgi:hypothetical protein